MKKRWFGWMVWLLLTACLYFFENNTGTRAVLICSLLVPIVPFLRMAFFSEDAPRGDEGAIPQAVTAPNHQEAEDPGDVRPYQPGDPLRRIHWKLSAKKGEILVRDRAAAWEPIEAERPFTARAAGVNMPLRKRLAGVLAGTMVLCAALLWLAPEARRGAQALCNRVFAASEAVNAYAYDYFPVAENQSTAWAVLLIVAALFSLTALTLLLRSRWMALGILAAAVLFQVHFGLPLPAWANILLFGALGGWMIRRPARRKDLLACAAAVLLAALAVAAVFPGVDAATETASEAVRDALSRMAAQLGGAFEELPAGETETRHEHTLSLAAGNSEAQTGREYRLATVEEEQISMPRFVHWIKTILLFLLVIALVSLPFAPFLLLNARKRKALEARKAFASDDVSAAVCAIFRQVIAWLKETGHDRGNLLYRDWAEGLEDSVPDGYIARFIACAKDFEEAAYSAHDLPEDRRRRALELLKETETALLGAATWRQRLRIRYWMCLCE